MNRAQEKRLEAAELRVDVASRHAAAEQAPDWLQAVLSAASDEGLMRLERMLADWPRDVVIPLAAIFAALDLPPEERRR